MSSDADALLAEIEAWSDPAACSYGELGTIVLNHPGFVPLLRKRGTLKADTAGKLRAFMRHFPDVERLPADLRRSMVAQGRTGRTWSPENHQSTMLRLGHPELRDPPAAPRPAPTGDKPRINAAVIRAAKLDGRDLPIFVTALIDMGLECWRDDRAAHGEAVA
ncbi:hypothetical protein [Sphingomonas gellani]|nr:hypothetical protein [Sphingomonas gellani]